ncbi:MAG: FAD:protein FMN transferase [bacterium]|nr:FAD:protein FMN transferase [bacterium]
MKETRIIMGMPITIEIIDSSAPQSVFDEVFAYFTYVDETFSIFKSTSEITVINEGRLLPAQYSQDMQTVFQLCEETKKDTHGFFDIMTSRGIYDPSGVVKGWSIAHAADMLAKKGYDNFYVEAGGDIQVCRNDVSLPPWKAGIRNPFNIHENIAVLGLWHEAIATSGTYIRGQHIYNPFSPGDELQEIVSLSVIGKNIYDADRFATGAFAMQHDGIGFIEQLDDFEGYSIDACGIATKTSGFDQYITT